MGASVCLKLTSDVVHIRVPGQLSQVIYLHNLQFKQDVPPNTILDWRDDSPAGPIAAFLQLITDLEIWLEDSDDPLGILGDIVQIRRPLDNNREAADASAATEDEPTGPDLVQKVSTARIINKSLAPFPATHKTHMHDDMHTFDHCMAVQSSLRTHIKSRCTHIKSRC